MKRFDSGVDINNMSPECGSVAGEEGVAVLAACNGVGEGASLTPQVISLLNKQVTAAVPVAVNHCPFDDDDGEFF